MIISELITRLNNIKNNHGDIPVTFTVAHLDPSASAYNFESENIDIFDLIATKDHPNGEANIQLIWEYGKRTV